MVKHIRTDETFAPPGFSPLSPCRRSWFSYQVRLPSGLTDRSSAKANSIRRSNRQCRTWEQFLPPLEPLSKTSFGWE